MKVLEIKDYEFPTWVTECERCESKFQYSDFDTHLLYNPQTLQKETWIQCPVCGKWIKAGWIK